MRRWIENNLRADAERRVEAQLREASLRGSDLPDCVLRALPNLRMHDVRMFSNGPTAMRIDGDFYIDAEKLLVDNKGGTGVLVGPDARFASTKGTFRSSQGPAVDNYGWFDSTEDRFG